MDLAQILTQLSSYAAGIGKEKEIVQAEVNKNQQIRQQSVDALSEIGDLKVEADRMDSAQKLEGEKRKAAVASAFNVDMLDPTNRVAYLAREQAAELDASLAQSRRASELLNMNIWESPLSYMVERPFAFRHAAEAEAAKGRANMIDKAIDDLNTQAQQSVQTQKAINTEFTIDEAENQARMVRMQADEAVRMAQLNKSNAYISDLKTLQGLDKAQLDAYTESYKLKNHEAEFRARMEELKANREARAKTKKSEEETWAGMFERYNLGADMMNKAKMTNMAEFQVFYKKNTKFAEDIMQRGETVSVGVNEAGKPVVMDGRIARTPGEVISALKQTKGSVAPSAEKLGATLQDQYTVAIQELRKGGLTKITEEDVAAQVNRQLMGYTESLSGGKSKVHDGLIKRMAANAEQDWGGSKNIFKAPSVDVIAQTIPALVQDPGWEQIAKRAALVSPSPKVIDMIAQSRFAVLEGKLSVAQAAKFIASYYKGALAANAANERYSRYAIPEDFNTRYRVSVPRVGTMDATNEFEVKRAMLLNFTRKM